jgi:hypothetical protein
MARGCRFLHVLSLNALIVFTCIVVAVYYPSVSVVLRYALETSRPRSLPAPAEGAWAGLQVHWGNLWACGGVRAAGGLPPGRPEAQRAPHAHQRRPPRGHRRIWPRQPPRPILLGPTRATRTHPHASTCACALYRWRHRGTRPAPSSALTVKTCAWAAAARSSSRPGPG